jgi:hypothetical protein
LWALLSNTSGAFNTALGNQCLINNTTGNHNTAVGDYSLYNSVALSNEVAIGDSALYNNTTGSGFNTAVGASALATNVTGSNNTALGFHADINSSALNNATAIGSNAVATASNQVSVGSNTVTSIGGQVGWSTFSDQRVKDNVQANVPGLDFITRLKPVTYNYNIDKENALLGRPADANHDGKYDIEKMTFSGFIAQDVDAAAKTAGYNFSGVDKTGSIWALRYTDFVPTLVKSVQEQQQMITDLKKQVADQQLVNEQQQKTNQLLMQEIEALKRK